MSHAGGPLLSTGPEIVPGLELRLVVSPDEKRCNLWLGQTKDIDCGFAFYSDKRGVIYEGREIGCEAPATDAREVKGRVLWGDFHRARGEYDDAIASYEDGLKLDPSNTVLRQKLDATIKECKKGNDLLNLDFKCGGTDPEVRLIPSGDFQPWNAPVTEGQMLPDNSIEGGLKPINLAMPPVAGSPTGAVIVLVIRIDPNGNVNPVRYLPDDNGLGPQVMAAAKGLKFEPPIVKGKPVSTSIQVKVTF